MPDPKDPEKNNDARARVNVESEPTVEFEVRNEEDEIVDSYQNTN